MRGGKGPTLFQLQVQSPPFSCKTLRILSTYVDGRLLKIVCYGGGKQCISALNVLLVVIYGVFSANHRPRFPMYLAFKKGFVAEAQYPYAEEINLRLTKYFFFLEQVLNMQFFSRILQEH